MTNSPALPPLNLEAAVFTGDVLRQPRATSARLTGRRPIPSSVPSAPRTPRKTVPRGGIYGNADQKIGRSPTESFSMSSASNKSRVDTWPATRSPTPSARVMPTDINRLPTKPSLLQHMEDFIARELALVPDERHRYEQTDRATSPPSADKLQIYRQCFQFFIENFKVYKSVLSEIMKTYEDALSFYMAESTKAPRLADELRVMAEASEGELEHTKARLMAQIKRLNEENVDLKALLDQRCREDEDIQNEMQRLKEMTNEYEVEREAEGERVLLLVRAVKVAENRHKAKCEVLAKLKVDYERLQRVEFLYEESQRDLEHSRELSNGNVPLGRHEELRKQQDDVRRNLMMDRANLKREKNAMSRELDSLRDELEELREQNESLREARSLTPRPKWGDVEETLAMNLGVNARGGKATVQLVSSLAEIVRDLRETLKGSEAEVAECKKRLNAIDDGLSKGVTSPVATDFMGFGTGKEIPRYLRWHGKVKNRQLTKREVERVLKEFWRDKRRHDANHVTPSSIHEFMYTWLKGRYGFQSAIVEWAYSIKEACMRYRHDADAELFLMTLDGRLSEQVYHDQMEMLRALRQEAESLELLGPDGKRPTKVKKRSFVELLLEFFPHKDERDLIRLKWAVTKDYPGMEIDLEKLFAEDIDGNQSEFVEMLRDQMVAEVIEYISTLEHAVYEAANNGNSVRVGAARDAIVSVDPKKPASELDSMINRGLQQPEGAEIPLDKVVDLDAFLHQLKAGPLKMHTKRSRNSGIGVGMMAAPAHREERAVSV